MNNTKRTLPFIDMDVLEQIKLILPGEACWNCHGSGKVVLRHGFDDIAWNCHICFGGGVIGFPVCECGDWQHQHDEMTGPCALCTRDPFPVKCESFRFWKNERPLPGTEKIVTQAFWKAHAQQ